MSRNQKLIVFVAVLASLLEIVDSSIVNVAIPTMMGNLGATLEDISMVVTGYAIANAIVLPLSAWLSERLGRRKYYLGCIVLFTLTSVACGLAPNLYTLIVFRIFQGLAGGALLPTSQSLIFEQFPKEKAGMAGAIFGMSVMIGPALGPTLGGYLTDEYGWRSIFNINLPLGILALVIGLAVIHNRDQDPGHKESAGFDALGLILLTVGIGSLQFILERGEAEDWFSSNLINTLAVACAVSLPTFVWWELRVKNPVVNVRLFKDMLVTNGTLLMAGLGFFLYAVVFVLPIFMGRVFHFDATQTGVLFIPGSILTAAVMPFVGRAMQKGISPKLLIFIGLCSIEIFLLCTTTFSPLTDRGTLLATLYIRGFAMAFLFVPINSSILSQFSGATMGQVSGLLNLFRQLGGSIGIALTGTLLTVNSQQNYTDLLPSVSLLRPAGVMAYQSSLQGMRGRMTGMVGFDGGRMAAIESIYGRVQNQVFMMSFLQLMWTIFFIFLLAFIPLYFLKFRNKTTKVVDAH